MEQNYRYEFRWIAPKSTFVDPKGLVSHKMG